MWVRLHGELSEFVRRWLRRFQVGSGQLRHVRPCLCHQSAVYLRRLPVHRRYSLVRHELRCERRERMRHCVHEVRRSDRRRGDVQRHRMRTVVRHERRLRLQQRLRRSDERRRELRQLRQEVHHVRHRGHVELCFQELPSLVHGFVSDALQRYDVREHSRLGQRKLRSVRQGLQYGAAVGSRVVLRGDLRGIVLERVADVVQ